jgi:two-component sensor histidine kinase
MVHELMYQTEQLSSVNIKNYLSKLIPGIQRTLQSGEKIKINLDIAQFEVNINQAIPLGLLMNELLTNSYKYAFKGAGYGQIDITMESRDDKLTFHYKDSGPGFTDGNDFSDGSSLGLSLINAQLEQLHSDFDVKTDGCFELTFSFSISQRGPHSNIS